MGIRATFCARRAWLAVLAIWLGICGQHLATADENLPEQRVAERGHAAANVPSHAPALDAARLSKAIAPPPGVLRASDGEHPFLPVLRWAKQGVEALEQVDDYSCVFVKRERVNGTLRGEESIFLKIRHRPFSVYGKFLGPDHLRGREVIYVAGRNKGRLWAHADEGRDRFVGTISLWPDGRFVMKDNRHPVTDIGILNLVSRLVEYGEHDLKYDDCQVKIYDNVKINGRPCLLFDARHPQREPEMRFHIARIYIDRITNLPTRYESYGWPREPGGPVVLMEEYTYLDVEPNRGFTDLDFDIRNPAYDFPPERLPSNADIQRAFSAN